ncbi:MAG: MaoC family dehydratase N-terminal domain-containing protein [Deltaproteobacteria bacterium]|nr:MaoC family dehydratase N-terminal domain-containing protein [Deltaproteobacteria bacterium]MBW1818656.1 MaoC family dehydratase N-terminal domain-containing protein [Deltaproteobacteria bacterium]MBW2285711.1 MaoC family dehydratase N-terminal domain-containing protein [Deltaproteobacteria bacterium]
MSVDLSVINKKKGPVVFEYDWKDVVLYALGVGATAQELPYVYEGAEGGLQVLPSFCMVPAMRGYPPVGDQVDFSRFLHGEQTFRLYEPLPAQGRVELEGEVTHIYDKGKAAVYHILVSGKTGEGTHLFDAHWVNFYLGEGGFGGDPGPRSAPLNPPEGKEPDWSFTDKVPENQAALYRLNGDLNPLHVDPEFARAGGQKRPILHGLCTYGYAVRALVNEVLEGDVTRFKSFKARFSSVVYPGDTLTTNCWNTDEGYLVQVETQRGVVMSNGVAEME